ncbi:MAG: hypothetical protein J0H69_00575 [Burkholderiales bacterium]|nr:hypothetical protein [Burkholderiales bacterium]
MKSTIKLGGLRSIVIEPAGQVPEALVSVLMGSVPMATGSINRDQLGAIIFALEQVAEVLDQRAAPRSWPPQEPADDAWPPLPPVDGTDDDSLRARSA